MYVNNAYSDSFKLISAKLCKVFCAKCVG